MLRIVLINFFFLILPTLIYLAYVYFVKKDVKPGSINAGPFLWLVLLGIMLSLLSVAYFIETEGGKPGEKYTPPVLKDGVIQPGRTE
jgi:RsiW-degrading membrane proteinase PrsW (M82 family)